jgi:hypothetical protein
MIRITAESVFKIEMHIISGICQPSAETVLEKLVAQSSH